ncbi:MAG: dUTP diphosphatase [Eubacteriales bacterium]|nr:dUTP diphosphatase [Eubacteriales bacterium]NLF47672.1 dUTP diphosphatase [Clostridiales bacterium]
MKVKIKSISGRLPEYKTKGSAGMDLCAYTKAPIIIIPGERMLVSTGIFIELPAGYEAQLRARSGLAIKKGLGMVNGVGTIDSDYRGEIKIPLINMGSEKIIIEDGDRIAQMVIAKYRQIEWQETDELSETERSGGGFGHTGIKK